MLAVLRHVRMVVACLLPFRLLTSCAVMVGLSAIGLRHNRQHELCRAHPEPSHGASLVQKVVRERVSVQSDEEAIHDATVPVQLQATKLEGGADTAMSFFSSPAVAAIPQQPNAGFLDPATQAYLSQLGAATSGTQQQAGLRDQAQAYLGQLSAATVAAQQQVGSLQFPTTLVSPRSSAIPVGSKERGDQSLLDVTMKKQQLDQTLVSLKEASTQIMMMQGKLDNEAEATRRAEQHSESVLKRLHESEEAANSMHKRIGDLEAKVHHQREGEAAADSMHKRIRELEAEVDHQHTEEAVETQLRNDLQSTLSQTDAGLNEALNRVAAAEATQVQLQHAAKDSEARKVEAEARLAAKTREEGEHMMSEKASEKQVAQTLQESSLAMRASDELVQQSAGTFSRAVAQLQEANTQVLKLRQELHGQKEMAQETWRAASEQERLLKSSAAERMAAERRLADSLAALQGLEPVAILSGTRHSDSPQPMQASPVYSQATSWPVPEPALPLEPVASAPETLVPVSSPELMFPLMEPSPMPVAPLAPLPAPPLVNARAVEQADTKRRGTIQGILNQLYILLAQRN